MITVDEEQIDRAIPTFLGVRGRVPDDLAPRL
jgi:hypothetical protein